MGLRDRDCGRAGADCGSWREFLARRVGSEEIRFTEFGLEEIELESGEDG